MIAEIVPEAVLALADSIEQRRGTPGPDASLARVPAGADPLVHQLVYSMLLWESSHEAAGTALDALHQCVVDANELRICSVSELRDMLPRDCPCREERADRLLCALNEVFLRENGLSLTVLHTLPKREARQYLDTIAGLPAFATARVMLIGLGGHAFPADTRLAALLRDSGALVAEDPSDHAHTPDAAAADLVARLERAVRAADAPRVYALLEAEAAHAPAPVRRLSKPERTPRRRAGVTKHAADTEHSDPAPTGDHTGTE